MIPRLLPPTATLLAKTLRTEWIGAPLPERCIVMFWHGKMFAGWYAMRTAKPIALVSKSKDGAYLSSVLRAWGYQLARGSSGKKGMEALEEAMLRLKDGTAARLVITPDGPRGPFHQFKRGAFLAARELDLPLYMLRIKYHSPVTFVKSWDQFELPKPFSRVTLEPELVDISGMPQSPDEQRMWLDVFSLSYA